MSDFGFLGLGLPRLPRSIGTNTEHLIVQHPLQRVLAFTGRSIDDVINDPIARNEVIGYYRLHRQIERACEAVDMDRWWNGNAG